MPILTIAIPTYNRAPRLRECLRVLQDRFSELGELQRLEIEILVVDNASTDGTESVFKDFYASFPCIRYVCNPQNLGIDGNIHQCSQLALGEWVELLSDDDILLPNALVEILEVIKVNQNANFLFLNMISIANELPSRNQWRKRILVDKNLIVLDKNQMVEICGIWLTFLSSFVFRRSAWNNSLGIAKYIGTDIYLSYALFDLLSIGAPSVFIANPLVAARAHFSGSYRIFYAFGRQWPTLLLQHAPSIGFDRNRLFCVLQKTIRGDLVLRVLSYRYKNCELNPDDRLNILYGAKYLSFSSLILRCAVYIPYRLLKTSVTFFKLIVKLVRPLKRI